MRQRRQLKMIGDGRPDIGEARAPADLESILGISGEDRHLLAGMICAAPRWIAAMIGRDDQKIVASQASQQLRETRIESFKRGGVTRNVATMAISRVKIDEIGEQQATLAETIQPFEGGIEQGVIAVAALVQTGSAVSEDIVDLADRDHVTIVAFREVQDRPFRGRNGEIPAVRRSLEVISRLADEWPRDNASDVVRIHQPACDGADFIQAFEPERILVRCNLEDAISRGVTDRLAAPHVTLAEFADDLRSGGVAISDDAGKPVLLAEAIDQLAREARYSRREITPVKRDRNASDFPVTAGSVLAFRDLARAAKLRIRPSVEARRHSIGRHTAGFAKAERHKIGNPKRSLTPLAVGFAEATRFRDMADCIRALVAVMPSIRSASDAHGIHYQDQGTHVGSLPASGEDGAGATPDLAQ